MFKVGQKVVCIKKGHTEATIIGKMYTITNVFQHHEGLALLFKETQPHKGYCGFYSYRFRPIDETFAEEVLEQIKESINEEELVKI